MLVTVSRAARLQFLTLTPACILPAWALARTGGVTPDPYQLVAVLAAALAAHASVNLLNDHDDFASGIDLRTKRTPFSGGSGALPAKPDAAGAVRLAGVAALAITILIGLYFVYLRGWPLLVIGLTGAALVVFYTGPVNRRPWLCLAAPGLGFGVCMQLGAEVALGGAPGAASLIAAAVTTLLVSNLLLLNQLPDIEADKAGGRAHLAIVAGAQTAARVYALLAGLAFTLLAMAMVTGVLPWWCALALLPLPAAVVAALGAGRYGAAIGDHPGYLALNAAIANLTPALLGIGLLLARGPGSP